MVADRRGHGRGSGTAECAISRSEGTARMTWRDEQAVSKACVKEVIAQVLAATGRLCTPGRLSLKHSHGQCREFSSAATG